MHSNYLFKRILEERSLNRCFLGPIQDFYSKLDRAINDGMQNVFEDLITQFPLRIPKPIGRNLLSTLWTNPFRINPKGTNPLCGLIHGWMHPDGIYPERISCLPFHQNRLNHFIVDASVGNEFESLIEIEGKRGDVVFSVRF